MSWLHRLLGFEDRRQLLIAAIVIAGGIALRVIWNLLRPNVGAAGEAVDVAISLAEGRGFAGAYGEGHGPTAHLLPISPMIGALVYSLFGVRSPVAEFVLASWSIGLVLGAAIVFCHVFRLLGTPAWARLGALAFVCLAPVYISQEAVDFRIWEGGLAVFLAATFLLLILKLGSAVPTRGQVWAMACVAALLFFVNPMLGLAAYVSSGLVLLRWRSPARALEAGLIAIIPLAALVTPWTLRNADVLGHPVLLRSNAGLELALATNPRFLSEDNPETVYRKRFEQIHPTANSDALEQIQRHGEVIYSQRLGKEASAWLRNNPQQGAKLVALSIQHTFAPEPWMFRLFGNPTGANVRASLASLVGVVGLAGLLAALWRRRPGWFALAAMVLIPALVLSPFQPVPRYTYLFYAMLTFCAADLLSGIVWRTRQARLRPARAGSGHRDNQVFC